MKDERQLVARLDYSVPASR